MTVYEQLDALNPIAEEYLRNFVGSSKDFVNVYGVRNFIRWCTIGYKGHTSQVMYLPSTSRIDFPSSIRYTLYLMNVSKEPGTCHRLLRLLYKIIQLGIFTKTELVDTCKDTENIPALMGLIKYDDYSVFDERRLEL